MGFVISQFVHEGQNDCIAALANLHVVPASHTRNIYRCTFQIRPEVRYGNFQQTLTAFLRCPADMRRYNAILRLEQRIVPADGFGGNNVQPSGIHLSRIKRICKILLYNERTAAVVENNNAVLHFRDIILVDNPFRFGEQRAMQRNDVGFLEQRIQLHIFRNRTARGALVLVIGQNAHAHCFGDGAGSLILPKPTIPIVFPASSISG